MGRGVGETQTDAPHVLDIAGASAGVSKAPAQPMGVGIQGSAGDDPVGSPELGDELGPGERLGRVGGKDGQQRELGAREAHRPAGHPGATGARVDLDRADVVAVIAAASCTSQDGGDPQPQFGIAEGLEHEVVGAALEHVGRGAAPRRGR